MEEHKNLIEWNRNFEVWRKFEEVVVWSFAHLYLIGFFLCVALAIWLESLNKMCNIGVCI